MLCKSRRKFVSDDVLTHKEGAGERAIKGSLRDVTLSPRGVALTEVPEEEEGNG